MAPETLLDASPLDTVARRLATLLGDVAPDAPALVPLVPRERARRIAAIDGSSTVVATSGAFLVGAHRAATVCLDHDREHVEVGPLAVDVLEKRGISRETLERLARAGYDTSEPLPPERALHLLRELSEVEAAQRALAGLGPGDLLLLDGPLQARTFPLASTTLLARAETAGVDVVGVCKSTSLTVGAAPALPAVHLAARRARLPRYAAELPAPPTALGRIYVANLTPIDARPFRFDVRAHDGDALRALGALAPLAGHPAHPGYPAPLARAHHAATLPDETRRDLAAQLEALAHRHGVGHDAWRAAFEDYHDVLDLGA